MKKHKHNKFLQGVDFGFVADSKSEGPKLVASQAGGTRRASWVDTLSGAGGTAQGIRQTRGRLRSQDQYLWYTSEYK